MTDLDAAMTEAPVLLDVITRDGRILVANATQERELGFDAGDLAGAPLETVYPKQARADLARIFEPASVDKVIEFAHLTLRRRDRSLLEVGANINFFEDSQHGLCARLAKFSTNTLVERLESVEQENEVLSSIIESARDAAWCIEFVEPVDLSAPDREIIRQVFENERYWRYCNDAMARFYLLPDDLDFNRQNVSDVFPHNSENAAFVQSLIDNNFHLDGAPSLDQRYDGEQVFAENDVRAHIRNSQMHRMWGTVRDLSKQRLRERELINQASDALGILAATPDPIIVVNEENRIEGANPAVEWCFGWPTDQLLGSLLTDVVTLDKSDLDLLLSVGPGQQSQRLSAQVRCRDGHALGCDMHLAAFPEHHARMRVVIALRSPVSTARTPPRLHAEDAL